MLEKVTYAFGEIITLGGGVTLNADTNNVTVTVNVREVDGDAIVEQIFYSTTIDFLAGVEKTFTSMNGGSEIQYSGGAAGEYFMEVILEGGMPTALSELRDWWGFIISADSATITETDVGEALAQRRFVRYMTSAQSGKTGLVTWYSRKTSKANPAFNVLGAAGDGDEKGHPFMKYAEKPEYWQLLGEIRMHIRPAPGIRLVQLDYGENVVGDFAATCGVVYTVKYDDRIFDEDGQEYMVLSAQQNSIKTIRHLTLKWLP